MKKTIITLTLLAGISLNLFAQREIPMFFDKEKGLTVGSWIIRGATYSTDGSKIATVFNNKKIAIWEAVSGREICKLAGHSDDAFDIMFSPNGRQLASFAYDSTIKIWDTTSGQLIRTITSDVDSITFSPDGNIILGTSSDKGFALKIWNITNGSEIRSLVGHTNTVWSITYSPDGKQLVTASDDRSIKIWDTGTGQTIRTINGEKPFMKAIYSPNGRNIAAYAYDPSGRRDGNYSIRIYNPENGQETRVIPVTPSSNNDIMYSPDGKSLL